MLLSVSHHILMVIIGGHRAGNEPAILAERFDYKTRKNCKINPLSSQWNETRSLVHEFKAKCKIELFVAYFQQFAITCGVSLNTDFQKIKTKQKAKKKTCLCSVSCISKISFPALWEAFGFQPAGRRWWWRKHIPRPPPCIISITEKNGGAGE